MNSLLLAPISPPPPEEEPSPLLQLEQLEPEWWDLWHRSGRSLFQSPAWLLPWARHFAGDNIRVWTLRHHGRLIALAPFYLWQDTYYLLGNGISDYLDICIDPEFQDRVRLSLSDLLVDQRCEFNQLDSSSLLPLLGRVSPGEDCYSLSPIDPPKQKFKEYQYYLRRATKEGKIEIHKASPSNCHAILDRLFALHQARWQLRGEPGALADPNIQSFHRAAVANLAARGFLRLYALHLNSAIIAVLYAFADARRTYYYLSGFEPAYRSLSPGTLLIGHALEQAALENHTTFDFLRGAEPYKIDWGAKPRPTYRLLSAV
jgi:CelD/BcsL family acetyltransferase involved in cellulose biosynthesis